MPAKKPEDTQKKNHVEGVDKRHKKIKKDGDEKKRLADNVVNVLRNTGADMAADDLNAGLNAGANRVVGFFRDNGVAMAAGGIMTAISGPTQPAAIAFQTAVNFAFVTGVGKVVGKGIEKVTEGVETLKQDFANIIVPKF